MHDATKTREQTETPCRPITTDAEPVMPLQSNGCEVEPGGRRKWKHQTRARLMTNFDYPDPQPRL